jgi:hypothetical protein
MTAVKRFNTFLKFLFGHTRNVWSQEFTIRFDGLKIN